MRKLFIVLFVILVFVLILLSIGLSHLGFFSKIDITVEKIGPYTFAYNEFVGPYSTTGPTFDHVYNVLVKEGFHPTLGMGIYYDDPNSKDQNKLRSDVGSIIPVEENPDIEKLAGLIKVKEIPRNEAVVARFEIKNNFSYMIGPLIVYPKIRNFMLENGYELKNPAYEFYDMVNNEITFAIPLEEEIKDELLIESNIQDTTIVNNKNY